MSSVTDTQYTRTDEQGRAGIGCGGRVTHGAGSVVAGLLMLREAGKVKQLQNEINEIKTGVAQAEADGHQINHALLQKDLRGKRLEQAAHGVTAMVSAVAMTVLASSVLYDRDANKSWREFLNCGDGDNSRER